MYQATRWKVGSKDDIKDAEHLLKYINNCSKDGIKWKINEDIRISAFFESSGDIDEESKAKGGYVISSGSKRYGGSIEARSYTSKLNGWIRNVFIPWNATRSSIYKRIVRRAAGLKSITYTSFRR